MRLLIAACSLTAACSGERSVNPDEINNETPRNLAVPADTITPSAKFSSSERRSGSDDLGVKWEQRIIPTRFHGIWARSLDHCRVANHNRFSINREAVRFFEGEGVLSDVQLEKNALAVRYLEGDEANAKVRQTIYFALADDGRMRVRWNENTSQIYRRCQGSTNPDSDISDPQPGPVVPTRFRGLYALDRRACDEDYTYNPAFQNVLVSAREVSFFETGGPVTSINVENNRIAITIRETVGDGEFTRGIYLAISHDGTVQYRAGRDEPVKSYVRCTRN